MKATHIFLLSLTAVQAQTGVLDLTAPANYADQVLPAYITKDNTPANNPITDLGATLGRVLFYDTRLSTTNMVSCASCHQQEHAFGDPDLASVGVDGTTGRHSMRLINSRFAAESRFFWDERAVSLEVQTSQPIQDHVEMGFSGEDGNPDFGVLAKRIADIEAYQVLFTGVFGDAAVTEVRVQRALSQFVRSIQSFDSKYDAGRTSAPNDGAAFSNFTAEENLGKQIFLTPPPQGGAGCAACHQPPEFDIDPRSGHNGVITSIGGAEDRTNTRSPSLRDVVAADGSPHGGFMHDASLPDLAAVINHYSNIPAVTQGLDARLRPGGRPQSLNLSANERAALAVFLGTLTGNSVYTDEKWASPFDAEGNLSLIVLPTLTTVDPTDDEMITVSTQGVPNMVYVLQTSADLDVWNDPISVTADATGLLSYSVTKASGLRFFQYSYEVE